MDSAPSTPRRRISSADIDSVATSTGTGNRSRLPSSDIPRTYSGLYGSGDGTGAPSVPDFDNMDDDDTNSNPLKSPPRTSNSSITQESSPSKKSRSYRHYQAGSNLLPFELSRNRNTDWIAAGGPALFMTYVSIILVFLLTVLAFVPEPKVAWTFTNGVHMLVTLVYLHWIKGNPADYMDGTQGEMNAMTLWEQIVSRPLTREESTSAGSGGNKLEGRVRGSGRDVLCVIPTLLTLASCYVANFQSEYAVVNVIVWAVVMLPKLPFMNGVRILGINKTTGIDDGDFEDDYDDDECVDTEEESAHESVGFDLDRSADETKKER
eukprot:scaffold2748_cov193-Alexandrium_tamarense.AAC.31